MVDVEGRVENDSGSRRANQGNVEQLWQIASIEAEKRKPINTYTAQLETKGTANQG